MDEIKLLAKSEKKLETLIQTVRIYSQDIRMEFGMEKCTVFVVKNVKRYITERVELQNQVVIRNRREKETYKYLK